MYSGGGTHSACNKFSPNLGACPWVFTPPNTTSPDQTANFVFVSAGPDTACSTNTNCSGNPNGPICGEAWASNINTGAGTPINRACGTFQGYWALADIIGYSPSGDWGSVNLYSLYGIGNSLPVAYGTGTYFNMYGCLATSNGSLGTGYDGGNSRVCGCYDWNQSGSVALTPVTQACCTPTTCGNLPPPAAQVVDVPNPLWLSTVFDRISWLKTACPTAYSYQFDDKASSFTCNQTGQFTSYQVVFCPAGLTGAPT